MKTVFFRIGFGVAACVSLSSVATANEILAQLGNGPTMTATRAVVDAAPARPATARSARRAAAPAVVAPVVIARAPGRCADLRCPYLMMIGTAY
jgi:hypothetical protein